MQKVCKCIECKNIFNINKKANQYNMDVEDKIYSCPRCGQLNYRSELKLLEVKNG